MKLIISIIAVCILTLNATGQNEKNNIPPGSELKSKADINIDYSYKIQEIPSDVASNFIAEDFFKNFDKQDLESQENSSKEIEEYYNSARKYYSNLSNRVKSTYTIEELWYIFQFDQKLTTKLQNIK